MEPLHSLWHMVWIKSSDVAQSFPVTINIVNHGGSVMWRESFVVPLFFTLSAIASISFAQVAADPLPVIYFHGGGGAAFSSFTSPDITSLFEEDYAIAGLDFPFSWNVNAGIRNILQIEYRRGDGAHDIINNGFVEGGELGTIATIRMDYDFEDKAVKFNPFFWVKSKTKNGLNLAYFIILGKGNVTYKDGVGDGFAGVSRIWGFEVVIVRRFVTAGASIKKYSINFDGGNIFGIPFYTHFDGSQVQIQIHMAVGLGI